MLTVLVEVGLDLPTPGRELPEHGPGDARDVGDPVADRAPLHPEALGQLPPEMRFVQVPDRRQPRVQRPGIERRPPIIARGVGKVGHHHMGVQVRVTGSRRAVPERRGNEPVAIQHGVAGLAPPNPARHLLKDLQRSTDRRVGRVADLVGHLRRPEREQQGHRLGGTEGGIEPRHHRHRPAPGQPIDASRIHMVEDVRQRLGIDLPRQPEQRRGGAAPLTRRLLGAGVVLLRTPATVST